MDWLFESPVTIVLLGVAALGVLSTVWVQTGKSAVLAVMAAVFVALIVGLAVERFVETDREKLERTIRQIARDVRANDRPRLYKHIDPAATELRARAQAEIPNYEFSDCTVTKIDRVAILADKRPKEAEADFMVRVAGNFSFQGQHLGEGTHFRYIRLYFVQDKDGEWKVRDYAHEDPSAAFMNKPLGR